jgi:ApeA N-terminal domain 1
MRIKEEIKKSGYFWLPSTPHKKIPGKLHIYDGGNIELEVFGWLDESDEAINSIINNKREIGRILGFIEKYDNVTLNNCYYGNTKNFSGENGEIFTAEINVRQAYRERSINLI